MKKLLFYTCIAIALLSNFNAQARGGGRGCDHFNGYYHADYSRGYSASVARCNYFRGGYYNAAPRVAYNSIPRVVCNGPRYINNGHAYAPQRMAYYYYPSANVYFNPLTRLYYYPYRGGWVSGAVLPVGFYINGSYRQVYCNANENIWAYNHAHINYYAPRVAMIRPRLSLGARF